jgi:hypothetical protein
MADKKEVAIVKSADFAVMRSDEAELREIIEANLGTTGEMSAFDFDRIKVPSGETDAWRVNTIDGPEYREEITGIIIWWAEQRAYWSKGLDDGGGNAPPDCSSQDSVNGVGDPGGLCANCALSKFGSADQGHGQACKQVRQMMIYFPDALLPTMISVPPTSLKGVKRYMMTLASFNQIFWGVMTTFALTKATNEAGVKYCQISCSMAGRLSDDEKAKIKNIAESMKPIFEASRPDFSDPAERDDAPEKGAAASA